MASQQQEQIAIPDSVSERDEVEDGEPAQESDDQKEEELNLRMFGINRALPIDEDLDSDAGLEDDAIQYLRQVRAEAAACPRVVRVEFDAEAHLAKQRARAAACDAHANSSGHRDGKQSGNMASASRTPGYVSRMLAARELQEGPQWAQPHHMWVRQLVTDFRSMRQWLFKASSSHAAALRKRSQLPPIEDEQAWDQICFGNGLSVTNQTFAIKSPKQPRPARTHLTAVATSTQIGQHAEPPTGVHSHQQIGGQGSERMDQGSETIDQRSDREDLQAMDQISGPILSTVLCIDQVSVSSLLQRLIARAETSQALSYADSQWLFALAAALEKPAHSDVVAALRSLTRRIAQLKCTLSDASDPQLPCLNTLAVVAGAYFGQDEKLVSWVSDMELP